MEPYGGTAIVSSQFPHPFENGRDQHTPHGSAHSHTTTVVSGSSSAPARVGAIEQPDESSGRGPYTASSRTTATGSYGAFGGVPDQKGRYVGGDTRTTQVSFGRSTRAYDGGQLVPDTKGPSTSAGTTSYIPAGTGSVHSSQWSGSSYGHVVHGDSAQIVKHDPRISNPEGDVIRIVFSHNIICGVQ